VKCNVANGWCANWEPKEFDNKCSKYRWDGMAWTYEAMDVAIKLCPHRKRMNRLEEASKECAEDKNSAWPAIKFLRQWEKEKERK